MNLEELLKKYADAKEQMRSLLDKAKSETRNLTDSERMQFEALEAEARMAEYQIRANTAIPTPMANGSSPAKRFAEIADGCLKGSKVQDFSLRSIQDEPTIHDVSTPTIYQELQKPLEQGLILPRLGGRVLYNVQGEPLWPFVGATEAVVLGENEAVGESTLTFSSIKSTPKRIAHHFNVSRRAINQSNLGLYHLVLQELSLGVARKLNRVLCDGEAHGELISPFKEDTMAQGAVVTRGHATDVTLDDILALEHAVLSKVTDNVGTPVFVMNWKMVQKLRSTEIVKGQSEMLLTLHNDGGVFYAMMLGRRVEVSNLVPDGKIYYGDFNYLGLPQYGDVNIVVDPYSGATTNSIKFTLNTEVDMLKIRKEFFAISKPKG